MLEEFAIECPYCGETFTALVDLGDAGGSYVQDCEVCCSPIRFWVRADPATGAAAVDTAPEDDP